MRQTAASYFGRVMYSVVGHFLLSASLSSFFPSSPSSDWGLLLEPAPAPYRCNRAAAGLGKCSRPTAVAVCWQVIPSTLPYAHYDSKYIYVNRSFLLFPSMLCAISSCVVCL